MTGHEVKVKGRTARCTCGWDGMGRNKRGARKVAWWHLDGLRDAPVYWPIPKDDPLLALITVVEQDA